MENNELVKICLVCKKAEREVDDLENTKFTHGFLSKKCFRDFYSKDPNMNEEEIEYSIINIPLDTCEGLPGPYKIK